MSVAILAIASGLIVAQANVPLAPGDEIPAFDLADQNGARRTFDTVKGRNGAFVLFHRSADW